MRLVVVYGIKTDDYGYFQEFYPSRRLSEECTKRSILLRFVFPKDVDGFLGENHSQDEKDDTICLVRGIVTSGIVMMIETAGFRAINGGQSLNLASDKLETAQFLEKNHWPTPKTWPLGDTPRSPFPWVLKPRFGSRGEGVRLVHSHAELAHVANGIIAPEFIAQEFITQSAGRDIRFFFAGKRMLAVAIRRSHNGALISNACAGGRMSLVSFGEDVIGPWADMVFDIARSSGLYYGSVDFLFLEKQAALKPVELDGSNLTTENLALTVCELNGSPGFEALETQCGLNIAGALLDELLKL